MAYLDGLSCALCFERYNDKEQLPIGMDCGHTFCKGCLIRGNIVACPTCRTTMTKPVSQLRPNYGVLDALHMHHDRDASSADIVQQSLSARVGRMGVSGSARFMLPPSSMIEVRVQHCAQCYGGEGQVQGGERQCSVCSEHALHEGALYNNKQVDSASHD